MICKPKVFILDVDGVMTDGKFYYSEEGKVLKSFGADDNDSLSLLKPYINIIFVTGDKKGFNISKKRIVEDMDYPLFLVSTIQRIDWIKERYDPKEVIYMGDGIFDHYVMCEVGYSIATYDSDENAKKNAKYVTKRRGGERAVAEACLHILKWFFEPYNPEKLPSYRVKKLSGEWTIQ
jgi:3-deoxy-D-manno-octulosonate 8-phosphate phosphatase (KDO 8-P phosphatase)